MSQIEKVNCSTPDFARENVAKLLALFPECAGEQGEVDFDKLRQTLSSEVIEGNVERYEFTWPGKRAAKAAASAATTKTLRPCVAESVGRDGTPGGFDSENLYIEGDNLEVLKLLQTSYANQVKMIYIDPPYNTGHDFVYRDRFSMTDKELATVGGAISDENCGGGGILAINDSAEARYHSNWCSMMYPRLKLARNLLRNDGVIFISIDDNEVTNARKLCDEIFGEANFEGHIHWRRRHNQPNDKTKMIGIVAEHIIAYAKNSSFYKSAGVGKLDLTGEFSNPDNDPKGPWASKPWKVGSDQSGSKYTITTPTGKVLDEEWMGEKATFEAYLQEGRIYFPNGGDGCPRKKYYQFEREEEGQCATNWWPHDQFGCNQGANDAMTELLGAKNVFSNPKPVELIRGLAKIANAKNDSIILDFFSGSATTAQSTIQLNAEDGGGRRFILVQVQEIIDPDKATTEDAKKTARNAVAFLDSINAKHTICEIGKERIRRAGKKIQRENATTAPNLDIGFRVLKLDSSSLNDTSATVSETTQEFENFDRIKSDRSPDDILFQMLLETRIPLSEPIFKSKVAGNDVFFVGSAGDAQEAPPHGAPLVACLDHGAKMNTEFFIEIAKLKPGIAFFRDDAFADDSARTNVQQAFDQFSPTTSIKVI